MSELFDLESALKIPEAVVSWVPPRQRLASKSSRDCAAKSWNPCSHSPPATLPRPCLPRGDTAVFAETHGKETTPSPAHGGCLALPLPQGLPWPPRDEMQNRHAGGVASVFPWELVGEGQWHRWGLSKAAWNQPSQVPRTLARG